MAEQQYMVGLVGSTDVLMHRYVVGMSSDKKRKEKSSDGSIDYSEEWKNTAYKSRDKTTIVIPSDTLQASIRQAGAQIKSGRGSMKSSAVTDIAFDDTESPVMVNKKPYTIQDIENDPNLLLRCGAVVQRQRVDRIRAIIPTGWKAEIAITSSLSKDDIQRLFETAGRRCGIGDWRPNSPKPGAYGRFKVEYIEVVE